jgi:hypothetical protein
MLWGEAAGEPMSIDAEEAAIRTVILGALMGHSEAGERSFDALFAMRQAETTRCWPAARTAAPNRS